jgi:ankyrin repeat protein
VLDNPDVLEEIIRLTSAHTWYKLLQIPDVYGLTPLHTAAVLGRTQCIRIIADSVTADQLIYLLRITDTDGRTPVQWAAQRNEQESVKLLQDYQTKALIDIALLQTDYTGDHIHQVLLLYTDC